MKKVKFVVTLAAVFAVLISLYPALGAAAETGTSNPPQLKRLTGVLNINTATAEQFMRLRGVNQDLANKVVKYREDNGAFKTIEDIKKVEGFTDKLFTQNQMHLSVSGSTTLRWVRVAPVKPSEPDKPEKGQTK